MTRDDAGTIEYETSGGLRVRRREETIDQDAALDELIDRLDDRVGALFSSGYEYTGRYTRWDIGTVDPPVVLAARGRAFTVEALTARGQLLVRAIAARLRDHDALESVEVTADRITGTIRPPAERFPEELRSRQPSVFTLVREIRELFGSHEDPHLGLYGAVGYDIVHQFETIEHRIPRDPDQRDLVLFLPDTLTIIDRGEALAVRYRYDFDFDGESTADLPREPVEAPYGGPGEPAQPRDHEPGQYAELVEEAKEWFARGDLFEVVPGQTFYERMAASPSTVFRTLREANPAPFSSLVNLGDGEYLVGASPEMFVRVEGRRVESCPISGTIKRGADVMSDADQILTLLNSEKDESELTMCTDVDRNDKSRICEPGSVRLIARRQIEIYSRLIHTVDHVEGILRDDFDSLDAFLSHAWAVTVTGAPKLWAMRFIEQHERSPRKWYGGAIGMFGFDGSLNTGLTIRTVRVKDGVGEIRAGGTLLIDSEPASEERETELKASAFLDAIRHPVTRDPAPTPATGPGADPVRVLLLDHEDSFVHTLANYLRQTGADVTTVRVAHPDGVDPALLDEMQPELVVLSPGPARPHTFGVARSVQACLDRGIAVFGVCLGLQGIVECFGGRLDELGYPMHGKASTVRVLGGRLLDGLPPTFDAGRYHSLFAVRDEMPPELVVTAETDDGCVMAVEHRTEPVTAVQFHPESILTMRDDIGLQLVRNAIGLVRSSA